MYPEKSFGSTSNALIYPTGNVLHVPEAELNANCNEVDLADFWGPQQCNLKFGSWTYSGNKIALEVYGNSTEVDTTDYSKNSPIQVTLKISIS